MLWSNIHESENLQLFMPHGKNENALATVGFSV